MENPMEAIIADALQRSGVAFSADPRETSGLDFRVDSPAVHIEVKQFFSPRIGEQMSRVDDVIAVQGQHAVEWFAGLIASRRVDELLTANNTYLQRARDAEAHVAELKAALTAHEDMTESCGICRHPFVEGVLTLQDVTEGEVHAACCGPERDCYVNLETGEPLGPDDPIPTGRPWVPDAVLRRPSDAEGELRALYRAYVNLLETGRDRIVANGGTCDAVDRMEEGDPALIRVRQFLADPVPPEWTGQGTDADFFEKPEPKP